MALSDPIADALTVIRNATRSKKDRAEVKASRLMTEILKVLRQEKFIHDYRLIDDGKQGILRVYLKKENEPVRTITRIQRVSRPGLRVYSKKDRIPTVLNGLGICILSTPEGILSGEQAKRRGVGGEIIARVW
ncbi:MAG: 30S ribosomal protein S8 [Omnitrophica bacterium RIFCSPHIGHO2_02_FULL_63_14]|nr:MAG: 30S ribosomal protein S8 [Omnitrophica bacterium RIFCSPHIGHO2_02_FULL_63_14]